MAKPDVKLYANIGTENTPNWTEVTDSKELVFTEKGDSTMKEIKWVEKPLSGVIAVKELWIGSTEEYSKISTYDGLSNANINVLKWTWDGAMNSAPIFTFYPDNYHYSPSIGDSTLLGGHQYDTNNTSYIKACMSATGLSSNWCTSTTGSDGAVTSTKTGQSLQGETQYLQLGSVPSGAGEQTLNILVFVGNNIKSGDYGAKISIKYSYT